MRSMPSDTLAPSFVPFFFMRGLGCLFYSLVLVNYLISSISPVWCVYSQTTTKHTHPLTRKQNIQQGRGIKDHIINQRREGSWVNETSD